MRCSLFLTVPFVAIHSVVAGDDSAPVVVSIDERIEHRLAAERVEAGPPVDERTFLRRVTLDLAGRIPTVTEWRSFLKSESPHRREELVDQLVTSPDFAFHLRNEIDQLLLVKIAADAEWRTYLLQAAKENRDWGQLFREIMLPEQQRPGDPGARAFLRHRANDVDAMTNDTSALLFGVNISCARCHDHPLVSDWRQDHYFGMASFFNRTYRAKTGFVGERFEGQLEFTTTDGDQQTAKLMFLTGVTVEESGPERDADALRELAEKIKQALKKDDAETPPLPEFSPRNEFVRLALESPQPSHFARNMVNRVWARLLGRGLVHPLDQMHSENPSGHPELLDDMAVGFAASGYDLRKLIRTIVLSRVYARSSVWSGGEPPSAELFACGQVRPLTPLQLGLSLRIAAGNPERLRGLTAGEEWSTRREQLETQANGLASRFEGPTDGFQVGVDEALFLSNSSQIETEILGNGDNSLVEFLIKQEDDDRLIDAAFAVVLSRSATDIERGAVLLYLAERRDRPEDAVKQVVWSLLASPEFRFNH